MRLKEILILIKPSPLRNKKYRAFVKNTRGDIRHIDFGQRGYKQYKDSTKIGKFTIYNHGDAKRRRNYFMRFSGVPHKKIAIKNEIARSRGKYNAKILSHKYLW